MNDLDIAFKKTIEKLESYKTSLKDFEKKEIIIWINDVYVKSNILLSLAWKKSDYYIQRLKNANNYHLLKRNIKRICVALDISF
ncbi:hypothetical protein [Mycoplasma phocimorsus]|uniref:hypothetical protein n=1 Tax=Mycoplasma phocimorsus TaxID=3045839 RepID=UPI0024C09387|nr:hypothetical protein [Mycoplasma phocimorsus]MDJ1648117.1 hypothetical protein [Mycoplasma phocimorsus]